MVRRISAIILSIAIVLVGVGVARSAAANGCADVEVLGERGSGDLYLPEQLGLGPALYQAASELTKTVQAAGHTIHVIGIKYPAIPIGGDYWPVAVGELTGWGWPVPQPYEVSRDKGTAMFLSNLDNVRNNCPASQIVLAGYSQGADALGKAIDQMSISQKSAITTVLLFGDTNFNPTDAGVDFSSFQNDHSGLFGVRPWWSEKLGSIPVVSYCHLHDPICNGRVDVPTGIGDLAITARDLAQYARYGLTEHLNYQATPQALLVKSRVTCS